MVGVKLLLLSIFFFQGIYGFCIRNNLLDGSSFKITHANSCVRSPLIEFFFADGINPSIKLVKCTTGGALTIYGTRQNYSAECIDANGVTTTVPIDDVPAP
ncbi:hypothetical protein BDF21DRAFT_394607 [Thamnidium elegans]|nr:hypothetical protein BDF21DRAFT_394607 [Thamnidium elegans]